MEAVFLKLLNVSITASWLVLAVLLLRVVLKKAPRWIFCLLWGLVGLRLVFPFSIESALSLIPSAETVPPAILYDSAPAISSGITVVDRTVNPVIGGSFAPDPVASVNPLQIVTYIAGWVWVIGLAVMMIYAAASFLVLKNRMRTATLLEGSIRQSDRTDSPFVLGVLRPVIYLPYTVAGKDLEYVIAHEKAHIARRDHWWKPLGFVLLAVYWFNPLMWVAYILLCRDIEAACDEKVVAGMEKEGRQAYSVALLNCSVRRRAIAACPLAFGEVGVKERIKGVMSYKKPAVWIIVAALLVCIVTAVCFLTDPESLDGRIMIDGVIYYQQPVEEENAMVGSREIGRIEQIAADENGDPAGDFYACGIPERWLGLPIYRNGEERPETVYIPTSDGFVPFTAEAGQGPVVLSAEERLLTTFRTAEPNSTVTDWTLAHDGAEDLLGVVQYTDEAGDPCRLAFVSENEVCHSVGLASDGGFVIASDSELTYLGEGTVTLRLYEVAEEKAINYTVSFSLTDNGVHFKAESRESGEEGNPYAGVFDPVRYGITEDQLAARDLPDFTELSLPALVAYYLHTDGAGAEGSSDELYRRFMADPAEIIQYLELYGGYSYERNGQTVNQSVNMAVSDAIATAAVFWYDSADEVRAQIRLCPVGEGSGARQVVAHLLAAVEMAEQRRSEMAVARTVWELDGAYTEQNNSGLSLRDEFGTALGEYGSSLTLGSDGSITFHIGAISGSGTYGPDGDTGRLAAEVTLDPGFREDAAQQILTLYEHRETLEAPTYMVMDYDGYQLFWKESEG